MKNNITLTLVAIFCSLTSLAQVGIGTNSPNANAALDVVSNSQGMLFPRMTTAERNTISSPAKGLTIFNTTLNCIQTNVGSSAAVNWKCFASISASSNGTAIVSAYTCNTASAGTITAGSNATGQGVTQTITATVAAAGTYNISATANGVTFAGAGTFANTGAQTIVLTATGIPTAVGSNTFTLNTTPNCSFGRTTLAQPSTNGTAVVSTYNCAIALEGTLVAGKPASGVTQTITATVGAVGTYSISTTANGITFAGAGTFSGTGAQNIVLTATGTPTATGSNTFTLNTTPNCNFNRSTNQPSTNGTAAVSAYTCSTASSGTLIVGSAASGVTQTITATVTTVGTYDIIAMTNGVTFSASGTFASTGPQNIVLSAAGTPTAVGPNTFTLNTTPNCSFDRTTLGHPSSNGTAVVSTYNCNTAFAGALLVDAPVSGVTQTITAIVGTVGTYNISASANGITFAGAGTFAGTGAQNIVLSATGTPTTVGGNIFTLNTAPTCNFSRITNHASSNGTAVVSAYDCATASNGAMTEGTSVSSVNQIITATVTTIGTYNIATTANGITFSASGTFSVTGAQNIVLIAAGTPTAAGANTFTLNTTPNCGFNRTTNQPSSNGTAVVLAYTCSISSVGTLLAGVPVTGVSQTITANVTTAGTFNISATANGITFAASGTFAGTGAQNIVLNATGEPTAIGANSFTLNTNPNCYFSRTTNQPSTNGTAEVSSFICAAGLAGTLTEGTPVSGVTQTLMANVTSAGTYNISTTIVNGVTFAASGTFSGPGARNILLTATGTPSAAGVNTFTLNTTPNCNFNRSTNQPSTNGTAVVSAYTCSTASSGTLIVGSAASGVTQTITATVTEVGTYNIIAINNGVTFSATGTFASTGPQNIVLSATGTPTAAGANTFTLNTAPNCSFDRTTLAHPSSNGTAVVSTYACATASAGTLIVGDPVSGVTQTITANVGAVGTYSISTTANGVTFSATGTFASTGPQNIVLSATGTPTAAGANMYTLNTAPTCSFSR